MSVLIVDPSSNIRRLYAVNLSTFGYMIHEADTLQAAWHASLICRPRLIIMEICDYAEGSALEFLTRLADAPHSAHLPVLIITTQSISFSSIRELENVREILTKPITRPVLLTAVTAIIGAPVGFRKLLET
jgi:DNA-binding response OmpR family regulator